MGEFEKTLRANENFSSDLSNLSIPMASMTGFSADCRTRSYVRSKQRRLGSTSTTSSSSINSTPAIIFEHYRGDQDAVIEDSLGQKSFRRSPSSFEEIETWLQSQVDEALQAAAASIPKDGENQRGAIKIIFINEKQCDKTWSDNTVTQLHPKLKIDDWTTAHYMTTYCRFPLPLHVDKNNVPSGHSWDYRYSVSHPFDWDLVWAYFPSTRTTVGILRTWFEDYGAGFEKMEDTIESFKGPTIANPMILGFLSLQMLTSDTMTNVREKGNRLYEAQCSTGFQMYTHLRTTEFDDDSSSSAMRQEALNLSIVTKEVLGAAANLTGWEDAAGQMIGFARFLAAESTKFADTDLAPVTEEFQRLCVYIDQQVEKQRDASMNIELAKNSNKIAMNAKRDSTSMMAIAVVTMFFLPGTFTSGRSQHVSRAFFAMPFVNETPNEPPRFWIYWAITAPLTIVVLTIWLTWIWCKMPRMRSIVDSETTEREDGRLSNKTEPSRFSVCLSFNEAASWNYGMKLGAEEQSVKIFALA
ncbi:hypothetical protein L207DRAFT_571716 [Hyaloscypha variabilis F]|uniref:Cora-domain-containing protein n=1 Tax=Hyaloscypha variabilis (strain UAMH 11265 / GT02V1 / F) TaxID=1149755 RepID=A0A2J6R305_HYAVF|nr:hypothetical protein L207DRAFT_571716 [Hyaloscypha variabilis F]